MDHPQKPAMKDQVPALRALQDVDRAIFRWTKERMTKPKALEGVEKEVGLRKGDHDARVKEHDAARKEVGERELELKEREERRKRLEAQRDQSKSNKEYQGYNFEIAATKAEAGKIEEEVLKLMSAVEEAAKKVEEAKGVLDAAGAKHAEAKKAVDAELARIDAEVKALKERRAAAVAEVHAEFLKLYDRIHKAKPDAVALAAAVEEKDGYHCSGCRMGITFQDVNTIMKGKDPVMCRSCSRILFLEAKPAPAPAK